MISKSPDGQMMDFSATVSKVGNGVPPDPTPSAFRERQVDGC